VAVSEYIVPAQDPFIGKCPMTDTDVPADSSFV